MVGSFQSALSPAIRMPGTLFSGYLSMSVYVDMKLNYANIKGQGTFGLHSN